MLLSIFMTNRIDHSTQSQRPNYPIKGKPSVQFGVVEASNASLFKSTLKNLQEKDGQRQGSKSYGDSFKDGRMSQSSSSSLSKDTSTFFRQDQTSSYQRQESSYQRQESSYQGSAPNYSDSSQERVNQDRVNQDKVASASAKEKNNTENKKDNSKKKGQLLGLHGAKGSLMANQVETVNKSSSMKQRISIIEKMSSQILLAQKKDGDQVMRLSLNKSLLPGVMLEISQGKAGSLNLAFISSVVGSSDFLAKYQKDIQQKVSQNIGTDVNVSLSSDHGGRGNDTQQRSRGLINENPYDQQGY